MHRLTALTLILVAACAGGSSGDSDNDLDGGLARKRKDAPEKVDAREAIDASKGSGSGSGSSGSLSLITEPDDGYPAIYDLISSAKTSIDMTMYELTDTTVTGLLTSAAKAGVTVRVILDQNLEKSSNTKAFNALAAGGVSVHWANTNYSATHQKSFTIDHATSAIMTLNLTPTFYSSDREFVIVTSDAADVAAIETTFGDDFTNATVTPPTGDDLVWSPTNSQASLVAIINGATTSLVTESEEMSDSAIVSALSAAAARGVSVEVVMTNSSSWSSEFKALVKAGVKVVTYASTASLYIHAKVILADYGTSSAKLFVGSENYSSASLTENRELGVVIDDTAIMSSVHTTLASDYAGGTPY